MFDMYYDSYMRHMIWPGRFMTQQTTRILMRCQWARYWQFRQDDVLVADSSDQTRKSYWASSEGVGDLRTYVHLEIGQ